MLVGNLHTTTPGAAAAIAGGISDNLPGTGRPTVALAVDAHEPALFSTNQMVDERQLKKACTMHSRS